MNSPFHRAAADKKAEVEKQGAIKELLATLTETFKGRQGETKQAVAEAKVRLMWD